MDKSTQVLEKAYKSLDGPGSYSPGETTQFRTAVENASQEQLGKANQEVWNELLRPAVSNGQTIPSNIIEQVEILFGHSHTMLTESAVGASTRSSR